MGTGSRQRHISQSKAFLGGNVPGENNGGETFRGEYSGHPESFQVIRGVYNSVKGGGATGVGEGGYRPKNELLT